MFVAGKLIGFIRYRSANNVLVRGWREYQHRKRGKANVWCARAARMFNVTLSNNARSGPGQPSMPPSCTRQTCTEGRAELQGGWARTHTRTHPQVQTKSFSLKVFIYPRTIARMPRYSTGGSPPRKRLHLFSPGTLYSTSHIPSRTSIDTKNVITSVQSQPGISLVRRVFPGSFPRETLPRGIKGNVRNLHSLPLSPALLFN